MTFTSVLETWLKVAAHPLPICSVYVKYESYSSKERVNMVNRLRNFFARPDMTLTLDLKSTLSVKCKPDWTEGREYMIRAKIFFFN